MKVLMTPMDTGAEGGIRTVIKAYLRHLPKMGVEFTSGRDYDVEAIHAGMAPFSKRYGPLVAINHGLYWGDDRAPSGWEMKANRNVISSLRYAKVITVPSNWVAQTLRRDMHLNPVVVPHGIDWDEWQHDEDDEDYVLGYYKNRIGGVCDPAWLGRMATKRPEIRFMATFSAPTPPPNVKAVGGVSHSDMKLMVQRSSVCVSTVKETFGLLMLEAMAAGKPVLAFDEGGARDLIQHGVNGYLAEKNSTEDLLNGLDYCLRHKKVLGDNGREMARQWSWEAACKKLIYAFEKSMEQPEPKVSVVVPVYNKEDMLERCVNSVLEQNSQYLHEVIIVNDESTDNSGKIADDLAATSEMIKVIHQPNGKVARARNTGIEASESEYIVCLDADDAIAPGFIDVCLPPLMADNSLGITYTGLLTVVPGHEARPSSWPGEFNYADQLRKRNQVPTCCMFKKEAWRRLGGYRSKYCPHGGGTEDAEFWTRIGAIGYNAQRVTAEPLFVYTHGQGVVSEKGYKEVYWLDKPWVTDGLYPFASVMQPKNRFSHPVRQYDTPLISVIIPVGPGHEENLWGALDSVENQDFRKWELVVVNDTGSDLGQRIKDAFPFVKFIDTSGQTGAGYARNVGVDNAIAPLIIFLDADDELNSGALTRMYAEYVATGNAIYGDYLGFSITDYPEAATDKMESYDEKTGALITYGRLPDYDCRSAMVQPKLPPYVWNCVVTLFPREWHYEVGGFDERMPSWEDWLYFINMARIGKCFTRIKEPLFIYNFVAGRRRVIANQQSGNDELQQQLIAYMQDNLLEDKTMGCSGCGKKVKIQQEAQPTGDDRDFVMALYAEPNKGMHPLTGRGWSINNGKRNRKYGYKAGGQVFLVHYKDVIAQLNTFKCPSGEDFTIINGRPMCKDHVVQESKPVVATPPPVKMEMSPPRVIETSGEEVVIEKPKTPELTDAQCVRNLMKVDGIGLNTAKKLVVAGHRTKHDVKVLTKDELRKFTARPQFNKVWDALHS